MAFSFVMQQVLPAATLQMRSSLQASSAPKQKRYIGFFNVINQVHMHRWVVCRLHVWFSL